MAKAAKKTATKAKSSGAKAKRGATKPAVRKAVKKAASTQGETNLVRKVAFKKTVENPKIQDFGPGDTVGVYVKVREGEKERIQLYKGVCIKIQGHGATRAFTVRKISAGVGVERTFPFRSPAIDRVEIVAHGKIRRSRLYFLRNLRGKAARLTTELVGLVDTSIPAESAASESTTQAE